ncbi:DUF1176 domain-containing protein [Sphingomonas canadensis]|uniref:DUF1176 domain-containing protein n=1 Tax=Sphingomonas canadensis TaxID=1219257 RepID=A0ABW3H1Q4_9SPHN|nr:DUF1176 domain-containing protein [Sphingomonas canadensis]MCW3834699.1 DUF1176 domain-containing protein [Sphingomonas canadensis]
MPGGRSCWLWQRRAGGQPAPLLLPEPVDRRRIDAGAAGLDNALFDFDFGILRSYSFRPGREDCGIFRAWAYTAAGWRMAERREMPVCRGLAPPDWIRTYRAPAEGAAAGG